MWGFGYDGRHASLEAPLIPVERVRALKLREPAGASQTDHVEAASGLAIVGDTVYTVADDELYLAIFTNMAREPGRVIPILSGELPHDYKERKERKPDLESLSPLAPFDRFEHGGLIALASGSSEDRRRGAFIALEADGSTGELVELDLGPLLDRLGDEIPGLNLEGTAVTGDVFRVLQRGNEEGSFNAHIDLDLQRLCAEVAADGRLTADLVVEVVKQDLGHIRGVQLCFSDADTLPDGRLAFSASAEPPQEAGDGPQIGSAVGVMTAGGEIQGLEPIDVEVKVEGLAARVEEGTTWAYMVTDEDSPDIPSDLCRVSLPWV